VLAFRAVGKLERDLNDVLRHAAPLAQAEASAALGREVRIGRLTPDLTVRGLIRDWRRRASLGTVTVAAEDIAVANGVSLAATGELASARRVTAYVSVPDLLGGRTNTALTRLLVEEPNLLLIRDPKGRFNVQDLYKSKPGPAKPPFVTRVEVERGSLTFRDQASRIPNSATRPQVNHLAAVNGFIDLSPRAFRFTVSGRAAPGTDSVARLGGPASASGVVARGEPGQRSDAPGPSTSRYRVSLDARDADGAYWASYFLGKIGPLGIQRARGDATVSLIAPRPSGPPVGSPPGTPNPPLAINVRAAFHDADVTLGFLKDTPVTGAAGAFRYNDGVLGFEARGTALGGPVAASGGVWGIGPQRPGAAARPAQPQFSVRFEAPAVPVRRGVSLFFTPPANISADGVGSVAGIASGSASDPIVDVRARVPGVRVRGLPAVRDVAARLTLSGGVLGVSDLTGRTAGGGTLDGRATVQVFAPGPAGPPRPLPPERRVITFAANATGVPLAEIDALRSVTAARANPRVRLSGLGDVQAVGRVVGTTPTFAANVAARGLTVGGLPFSTAAARVVAERGRYAVSAARLVSPAGTVELRGDVNPAGNSQSLDLRFAALGLDVARLGRAFGFADAAGLVSATGRVTGTVADPRVVAERVVGLNLRHRTYALDAVTARNVVATRDAVAFPEPVNLRRFPAEAGVTGRVTGLALGVPGRTFKPVLDLTAQVSDLDYNEVLRQLPSRTPTSLTAPGAKNALASLTSASSTAGEASGQPLLAAVVNRASARIRGPLDDLRVNGTARLGRLLVGPYPIDRGWVDFAYRNGEVDLTDVSLAASVGVVRAKAKIDRKGVVSGSFAANGLDLEPLSFLTKGVATLGGDLTLNGTFSGTQRRPVVTLNIAPSDIEVAGTPLTALTASGLRYVANLDQAKSRIEVPRFSFRQGDTAVSLAGGSYDLGTRRFAATASVETGDVGVLLGTLRRSGLVDTPAGARFVDTLNRLPAPIGGRFAVERLTASGRVGDKGRLEDVNATARIAASNFQVGTFRADTVALRGAYRNDVITLEDPDADPGAAPSERAGLRITSGDTSLLARGRVDLNGELNVVVDSNAFSLDVVRSFLPETARAGFPLRGVVSLTVAATGRTAAPRVQASVEGRDLRVGGVSATLPPDPSKVANPAVADAAAQQVAAQTADKETGGVPISLLRAEAELIPGPDGSTNGARLVIPEVLVTRAGGGEVRLDGELPFSYEPFGIDPGRAVSLRLTVPRQPLAALFAAAETAAGASTAPGGEVGGDVVGNVTLGGTLARPELGGSLSVIDGSLRLPQSNGRDPINPVTDFDATLRLDGPSVVLDQFRLALGGPNGQKGDFGTLTATGDIEVRDLQGLLGRGVRADERPRAVATGAPTPFGLNSRLNLSVRADGLRVVEANLLDYGEAFRSTIDGAVTVTGPLSRPLIATAAGQPVRVRDTRVQLPTAEGDTNENRPPFPILPRFDLSGEIVNRATLVGTGLLPFSFDVDGFATVRGQLFDPATQRGALDIRGDFETLGGYLQYAFARFTVDKGGAVTLAYQNDGGYIGLDNVTAKARVYQPRGAVLNADTRLSQGGGGGYVPIGTQQPDLNGGTRYRITATLGGRYPLGDRVPQGQDPAEATNFTISLTSDPFLTDQQIIALIGTKAQLETAARGDIGLALQQGFQQALQSSILPGVFQPFENQVASALGLESFSLDLGSDAPAFTVLKRLPDPLDRFVIGYTRALRPTSNTSAGSVQPYTISLSYDFKELNLANRYRPRLQVGAQTDEQRNFTGYLRALITY
jgi:hypothetical protein